MNAKLIPSRAPLAAAMLALSACASLSSAPTPSESDFATIRPGMTRDQVIARFGRPTWSFNVRQDDLTIMNYRHSHSSCTVYQVSVRPDGIVRDAGLGPDPACDQPD